jgi:sortase A
LGVELPYSRALERTLVATGVVLISIYVAAIIYRSVAVRLAVQSLEVRKQASDLTAKLNNIKEDSLLIDRRLWSRNRITAYLESLKMQFNLPLAILRVPKLKIEAPVFEGTSDLALHQGLGSIPGTTPIGESGNIGIAGHRDGFFRALKDIAVGDILTLTTERETFTYIVDRITTVSPTDVSVLAKTSTPFVTLVTCYPFYFIGHAPQRYIVRCSRREHGRFTTLEKHLPNGAPKSGG